ncbi:hypothetical protein SLEP1_g25066 [Rubroshorea leprosula]|uniref:Uncharacterized protein n=1 Tax=Rubroshorea leprosula TaxID=152421 RepID=A0AAV5JV15_9ROSI|nr:hypothetical protein SLEP1_g25066 [Rubroshorea leprosula]
MFATARGEMPNDICAGCWKMTSLLEVLVVSEQAYICMPMKAFSHGEMIGKADSKS